MKKIIVGIDPDSNKSGLAIFENGKIIECCSMCLYDLFVLFSELEHEVSRGYCVEIHIEDLCAISHNGFNVRSKDNISVKMKKAEHVGRCKQVQIEIEKVAKYYGLKLIKHKVCSAWKKDKEMFHRITNWNGTSNEDSRSAAYFAYCGVLNSQFL